MKLNELPLLQVMESVKAPFFKEFKNVYIIIFYIK